MNSKLLTLLIIVCLCTTPLAFAQEPFVDPTGVHEEDYPAEFYEELDETGSGIGHDHPHPHRPEKHQPQNHKQEPPMQKHHTMSYIDRDDHVFDLVFEHLGEMDEDVLLGMCENPEDIVDYVMTQVDDKLPQISVVCEDITTQQQECKERAQQDCEGIMGKHAQDPIDDLEALEWKAWGCPVDEDAIVKLCMYHVEQDAQDKESYATEDCEYEWEDYGEENDRYCEIEQKDAQCDKSAFIDDCMIRHGAFECEEVPFPDEECHGYWDQKYDDQGCVKDYYCVGELKDIEEFACAGVYEPVCGENGKTYSNGCEAERQGVHIYSAGECISCETDWDYIMDFIEDCESKGGEYEKSYEGDCVVDIECHHDESFDAITGQVTKEHFDQAENACHNEWEYQEIYCDNLPKGCGKDNFIEQCVSEKKKFADRDVDRAKRHCKRESQIQVRERTRECKYQERDYEQCKEDMKHHCDALDDVAQECTQKLTRSNFEEHVLREAYKHCGIGRGEVFEKDHAKDIAKRLRDLNVPDDVQYDLNKEVTELEQVSEDLEEFEIQQAQKGLGYSMKLFLGFAKDAEESEINNLEASKKRLQTSIDTLTSLASTVEDDATKAILEVQVQELQAQQQDIDAIIASKEKKANGLLQLFGLFS